MIRSFDCKLVLEDGSEYRGYRFGAKADRLCEVVFNTSMVGYQEIVSDPSYTDQAVVMTYPIIGNYGVTDEDYETKIPTIGGLVVREYNDIPSNFRYTKTLSEILEDYGIPGMEGVDTRKLARSIRDHGSRKGLICDIGVSTEEAVARLSAQELPRDQVSRVSCKKRWYARTSNHKFNVVAVDCGIKLNIVRSLNQRHCNVTVVPYDTPAETILDMEPDGLFLSNGPGDPEDVTPVIELVRKLRGRVPIFGICLGHQLLALAHGFTIRYQQIVPPKGVDVFMAAPKGPGHTVRSTYVNGKGVPCLVAVEQNATGDALKIALAYIAGIGGARAGIMETTFHDETETDLFGEQAVLCGGVVDLMLCGFETLVEAGYEPENAYFECIHEMKLIIDLINKGGVAAMNYSISDTAEFGEYVSGPRVLPYEETKKNMRAVLSDIQDGTFAGKWIAENKNGRTFFNSKRALLAQHPMETVGAELRKNMLWGDDTDLDTASN